MFLLSFIFVVPLTSSLLVVSPGSSSLVSARVPVLTTPVVGVLSQIPNSVLVDLRFP